MERLGLFALLEEMRSRWAATYSPSLYLDAEQNRSSPMKPSENIGERRMRQKSKTPRKEHSEGYVW